LVSCGQVCQTVHIFVNLVYMTMCSLTDERARAEALKNTKARPYGCRRGGGQDPCSAWNKCVLTSMEWLRPGIDLMGRFLSKNRQSRRLRHKNHESDGHAYRTGLFRDSPGRPSGQGPGRVRNLDSDRPQYVPTIPPPISGARQRAASLGIPRVTRGTVTHCLCAAAASAPPRRPPGQGRRRRRLSQGLRLEREAKRGSRSETVRTGATPLLPLVREREAEREKLQFGAIDAKL